MAKHLAGQAARLGVAVAAPVAVQAANQAVCAADSARAATGFAQAADAELLEPAAVALRARLRGTHGHRAGGAEEGVLETDLERLQAIGAAGGRRVRLAGVGVIRVGSVRVFEQGREQAVVGLAQAPEVLERSRVGIAVGVPLHRQLAKGALDLVRRGAGLQPEQCVGIGHLRYRGSA